MPHPVSPAALQPLPNGVLGQPAYHGGWGETPAPQRPLAESQPAPSTAAPISFSCNDWGLRKGLMVFFHSDLKEELTLTCTRMTGTSRVGGSHGTSWVQDLWGPILEMRSLREDQTGKVVCLGAHRTAPCMSQARTLARLHPASNGASSLISPGQMVQGWAIVPGCQPSGSDSSAGCFPASD